MNNIHGRCTIVMRKKKRNIVIIILIVLTILAIALVFISRSKSPSGQLTEFKKAVLDKDSEKVAKMLNNNEENIGQDDARNFIIYMNQNKDKFNRDIERTRENIENEKANSSHLGSIHDKNNRVIVDISKDGNMLFVFNKISFHPRLLDVYIREGQNAASYSYTNNNNKHTKVKINKNDLGKLGAFMVGDYVINAKKEFEVEEVKGEVEGNIKINTDNINKDGKIEAIPDFKTTSFEINLVNNEEIQDIDLVINDHVLDYKEEKVYGEYPGNYSIDVYAKGKINGKVLKTNNETVFENENGNPQQIKLSFDEKEVKEVKEKDKQTKEEVLDFMKSYTRALNGAYEQHDFSKVENYYEDINKPFVKSIKHQIEHKNNTKYDNVKLEQYKHNSSDIEIVISKTDKYHNKITSRYKLTKLGDNNSYKITNYTDV